MRFVLFCLLSWLLPTAEAALVTQTMRPGIVASASYLVGDHDKPAILLVHGFLQTREFPTVATLAGGLHDSGYTVLSPTLSLNIPMRAQSLACEAIHKHTFEEDVDEIARWVLWLKAQGHRAVVLVGHSFGSLQNLAYLSGRPDPVVKGYIGASLVEAQIGKTIDRRAMIAQLEDLNRSKPRELISQPLSFCLKYTATPGDLLTYVRWGQARTLAAVRKLPVQAWLIMGDADNMASETWIKALQHVQIKMVMVKGANHFMDGEHEFDLLEHTLAFLGQPGGKSAQ